jgi:UDP-N-acetylglucosamine--N-acetylmuramyl-(pentapeptide) pyrophosphoryl-undecaprenol N-acetylglucosamine transferase
MSKPYNVVIAAGGTGGHVFPGIATAEALNALGHSTILATDSRGKAYQGNVRRELIAASSLRGGAWLKVKGLLSIIRGILQASLLLHREKIDLVIGFGGFPSLPTLIAAKLMGCPIVLHEQNAVLGKANRIVAKFAQSIAVAFENVRYADSNKTVLIGNPIRAEIADSKNQTYNAPSANGPIRVLIFGGSQGARVFGDLIPTTMQLLPYEFRKRIKVVQQCRPEDIARVRAAYVNAEIEAEIAEFFHDMPERLEATHIVISRSGASTVAELTASGRPSLLIPYAAATDDHQTANAEALTSRGAAWCISENEASAEQLAEKLSKLFKHPGKLSNAANAAKAAARTDAAVALANFVETILKTKPINPRQRIVRDNVS